VQQALVKRCRELGVEFLLGSAATGLLVESGAVRGVRSGDVTVEAPRVVLAAGGRSYRELGGTGGGYALAEASGHEIVQPIPALVDLKTKETWPASCAGISVASARVRIERSTGSRKTGARRERASDGDVLFTHEGLSGPAVLDLSGDVMEVLGRIRGEGASRAEAPIRLELWPGMTADEWRRRLDRWRESAGRKTVASLLAMHMPSRLAEAICSQAGVGPDATAAHLDSLGRRSLAESLAGVRLTVVGCGGWESAMVTRGGVSLKQVDGRTMGSRLVKGLYFAGEVLDADGPCGGFNLQWAFSSGRLAGRSAAR